MSQTTAEKDFCKACGTDVRPQADFCYNCGGAVSVSAVAAKNTLLKSEKASESESLENEKEVIAADKKSEIIAPQIESEKNIQEQTPLKSAAAMRRKPKSYEKKNTQIVWEEYDGAPNIWFVLVAVILTLLAVGVFFLAMYLR